jgi:hypothetical protein
MIQDSLLTKQRHEQFIKKICDTEIVWCLENKDGLATSSSNEFEDDNGEPVLLVCFWSEKAQAKSCVKDDWHDYKPVEISLSDFIEYWCVNLSNDGYLIGSNFDQNMFGHEVDPLELILDLSKELKNQKKEIELENYQHFSELIAEIEKIINE